MKRILPEDVIKAYKRTGYKPSVSTALNIVDCKCPAGVLMVGSFVSSFPGATDIERHLGTDYQYAIGFISGFEGSAPFYIDYDNETIFIQGYLDGIECHLAVRKLAVEV